MLAEVKSKSVITASHNSLPLKPLCLPWNGALGTFLAPPVTLYCSVLFFRRVSQRVSVCVLYCMRALSGTLLNSCCPAAYPPSPQSRSWSHLPCPVSQVPPQSQFSGKGSPGCHAVLLPRLPGLGPSFTAPRSPEREENRHHTRGLEKAPGRVWRGLRDTKKAARHGAGGQPLIKPKGTYLGMGTWLGRLVGH